MWFIWALLKPSVCSQPWISMSQNPLQYNQLRCQEVKEPSSLYIPLSIKISQSAAGCSLVFNTQSRDKYSYLALHQKAITTSSWKCQTIPLSSYSPFLCRPLIGWGYTKPMPLLYLSSPSSSSLTFSSNVSNSPHTHAFTHTHAF